MVVVPEPAVKGLGAFVACAVDGAVGPAVEQGADEAFGFAVGLWAPRSRAEMADPEAAAGEGVDGGDVGAAVVGEDAFDLDAVAGEEGECALEEADRGGGFFVGEDFGVGETAVVVDGDVDELPADRAPVASGASRRRGRARSRRATADAFAGATLDAAELLDVDVDELARP